MKNAVDKPPAQKQFLTNMTEKMTDKEFMEDIRLVLKRRLFYCLNIFWGEDNFKKRRTDFLGYKSKKEREKEKQETTGQEENDIPDNKSEKRGSLFSEFMKRNSKRYFRAFKKSITFDTTTKQENEAEFIDIVSEKIL